MSTTTDSIQAGSVNTQDIRPWNKPQLVNTTKKKLLGTYTSPPRLAIGLNSLDMSQDTDIRIDIKASDITTTDFTAALSAWSNTILYVAGMSYLELGSKLKHIQTGMFQTIDVRPWNVPTPTVSKRINFDQPFTDGPPKVVCWLRGIDTDHKFNCRVSASALNIDQNGFTATITSWADTILYAGAMTWIAYPAKQTGVASGDYGVCDNRSRWNTNQKQVTGKASFGNAFNTIPSLVVGLNTLDFGTTKDLRIVAQTSDVTESGFNWLQGTWADSLMYEARASWFAWTDLIETPTAASIPQSIPSWVIEYTGHYSAPDASGKNSTTITRYVTDGSTITITINDNRSFNDNGNKNINDNGNITRNGDDDGNTTRNVNDSSNTTRNINDNSNTTRNVNDSSNTTRNVNNSSSTTRNINETDIITRSINDDDIIARYSNSLGSAGRYSTDRYSSGRYDSDRYSSDRYDNDRYSSDRYDSDRYNSSRTSGRYGDLDRGSTRYSDLSKVSISSSPRSDRVVSSGRIGNLDASLARIGNLDATSARIGGLDASSGRMESTERITSMERIGPSEEIETSETFEESGATGYTTTERITSSTFSSS